MSPSSCITDMYIGIILTRLLSFVSMFVCVRLGHLVWGEVGSHKRTYVVYEGRGWGVCVTGFSLFVLVCYTCLVCYVEGVGGVYVVGLGSFLPFFNSFSICYLLVYYTHVSSCSMETAHSSSTL